MRSGRSIPEWRESDYSHATWFSKCATCARDIDPSARLKCSQCKTVAYCDRGCQKRDWLAGHKLICKNMHAYDPVECCNLVMVNIVNDPKIRRELGNYAKLAYKSLPEQGVVHIRLINLRDITATAAGTVLSATFAYIDPGTLGVAPLCVFGYDPSAEFAVLLEVKAPHTKNMYAKQAFSVSYKGQEHDKFRLVSPVKPYSKMTDAEKRDNIRRFMEKPE